MQVGETVLLSPAKDATQRTKNRINENGPAFTVRSEVKRVVFDKGTQEWVLLLSQVERASDGNGGKEAWSGWLPVEEIEVVK